ncbi:hypothetical protein O6H91_08G033700 [Diphasiastrum complanatum]|uniref:Uncharacterized protein n=3 Tax=Diphasiastrum complanatum TaxID=34168 RepID=A0ACC2CX95_DIPCM|nr:hypothetical protein O6H91_08G033700 [Diphasiastrum complanatum]KAJ7546288.1 hypothetical protein O6H91_08G033700 [Diphasiastrum complanatum]KAJ7546289.1 hypothetical protein O6H91_08G033700 [Diphasiastrum complanatum]
MGRAPCCEKESVKRGPWTPEEDAKLLACISQHGTGSWRTLPKKAGLQRCGKSCRLRWTNYLRPDLKHGRFSDHEEQMIVKLHAALGSRWSLIAAQLPGRTDNDVKNYWNTRLKKKLCEMGIDPITHKPISQLLADLAGSISIPKGGQIAEAALGCFKDDMLNVLMRKRPDWQLEGCVPSSSATASGLHLWELGMPAQVISPPKSTLINIYETSRQDDVAMSKVDSMMMFKNQIPSTLQSKLPPPLPNNMPSELLHGTQPLMTDNEKRTLSISSYPYSFTCQEEDMNKTVMDAILDNTSFPSDSRPLQISYGREASSSKPTAWMLESSMESLAPYTALGLHVGAAAPQLPQQHQHSLFLNFLQQQQQEESSPSESRNTKMQLDSAPDTNMAWSPGGSGSSCSSTSLGMGGNEQTTSSLDGVLSSDALLWDFSDLSSIIS